MGVFNLEDNGKIEFAHWQHPLVQGAVLTQSGVDFYKRWLSSGDTAIDIGAYTGDTTVPMALAVGKKGVVLALEPNPHVFKVLEKNAELNQEQTHIIPLPFAATKEDGEFTFNYSDASYGNGGFLSSIEQQRHGHHYELKVKGIDLNRYLRDHYPEFLARLKLIKVDAEGYDKEILKNIGNLIREFRPVLMVECYRRLNRTEREELYQVIQNLGYDLYFLENFESDGRIKLLGIKDMHLRKHFEMLALPKEE